MQIRVLPQQPVVATISSRVTVVSPIVPVVSVAVRSIWVGVPIWPVAQVRVGVSVGLVTQVRINVPVVAVRLVVVLLDADAAIKAYAHLGVRLEQDVSRSAVAFVRGTEEIAEAA